MKLLIAAAAFSLSGVLAGCGDSSKQAALEQTENKADKPEKVKQVVVNLLTKYTRNKLKDSESAQFRNLEYYATYLVFNDGKRYPLTHQVCGEINAKNSYGGYVGYKQFVATAAFPIDNESNPTLTSEIDDPDASTYLRKLFLNEFEKNCKNNVIQE